MNPDDNVAELGRRGQGPRPSNYHQQLKSTPGQTAKAYAIFRNCSPRVVDILWLNWSGIRINYTEGGMKPRQEMRMNTFVGHPWIFRDHHTGDKLVSRIGMERGQREVYFPVPWGEENPNPIIVNIQLPVYTLLERSLQVVRSLVKNKSDFDQLDIPKILISQLANPEDTIEVIDP